MSWGKRWSLERYAKTLEALLAWSGSRTSVNGFLQQNVHRRYAVGTRILLWCASARLCVDETGGAVHLSLSAQTTR